MRRDSTPEADPMGSLVSRVQPDRSPTRTATVASAVLAVWALVATGCAHHPPAQAVAVRGMGGVVVSSDTLATRVGMDVLREGGNAVDAAVATALAMAVTFPAAGNLGGGGFLVAYDPETRSPWGLDFRETAPARTHETFYAVLAADGHDDASRNGPLAAGIPGSVAGLYAAWQRGGNLPWERLVEPARRLAADGFVVGAKLERDLMKEGERLRRYPSTVGLFFPVGEPWHEGAYFVQPDLARVLAAIQTEGAGVFYEGWVAETLVREVQAAGGVWTEEDLRAYVPRELLPVRLPVRGGVDLVALPPPSSGAVVLGQALFFLSHQDAARSAPESAARARAVVESLRLAFADRNAHLGDPASMRVSVTELLDPSYLEERARLLPAASPGRSDSIAAGEPRWGGDETTPLIALDSKGGAVSLTTSLNSLYGSGFVVPGTGILLNNEMDDFDTRPGEPNIYDLVGTGVNEVRPGARMLSSISPCLVMRDDEVWLGLGARGGPRILSSLLQVLYYRAVDGFSLDRAVSAPRLHHQWLPDEVWLEPDRQWPELRDALSTMGYRVIESTRNAKVHAAERLPGGEFIGVTDPREHGLALTVTPH